jgi:hypothetical protein
MNRLQHRIRTKRQHVVKQMDVGRRHFIFAREFPVRKYFFGQKRTNFRNISSTLIFFPRVTF